MSVYHYQEEIFFSACFSLICAGCTVWGYFKINNISVHSEADIEIQINITTSYKEGYLRLPYG